jgi:putative membrane protein
MASEMDWWAVPLVAFVAFTLYGIEGIAQTYEDPFGVHKIDINMDDIVEDARREVEVLLTAWQTQGPTNRGIFRPRVGDATMLNSPSDAGECYSDLTEMNEEVMAPSGSQVKFVLNDASERSSFRDEERERSRSTRFSSSASPGSTPRGERSGLFET